MRLDVFQAREASAHQLTANQADRAMLLTVWVACGIYLGTERISQRSMWEFAGISDWESMDHTSFNTSRPLRRVRKGALIAGVCGGLAKWIGWDPTIVRLLYIVATIASIGFPGILTYLVLWLLMPRETD